MFVFFFSGNSQLSRLDNAFVNILSLPNITALIKSNPLLSMQTKEQWLMKQGLEISLNVTDDVSNAVFLHFVFVMCL